MTERARGAGRHAVADPEVTRLRARDGAGPTSPAETRTKLERVLYVRGMVSRAEWVPGTTSRALAAAWSCSVKTVEGIASEAHRMIRAGLGPEEVENIRGMLVGFHQTVAAEALKAGKFGEATRAAVALGEALGISAPKPVAVPIAGVVTADAQREDMNQALARAAESVRAKWHEAQRRKAEAAAALPAPPATESDEDDDEDEDEDDE